MKPVGETRTLKSLEDTQTLATQLADQMKAKTVVALYGQLGSGKTTFSQLLGRELGIKSRMPSPTFLLERSYPLDETRMLYHFDLYRLSQPAEVEAIGLIELLTEKTKDILLIEWPEIIESQLPNETIRLKFTTVDENIKQVEFLTRT